jgi:hypothetical protein
MTSFSKETLRHRHTDTLITDSASRSVASEKSSA